MANFISRYIHFSSVSIYRMQRVLFIAFCWMLFDAIFYYLNSREEVFSMFSLGIRAIIVFAASLVMGYIFVFTFRNLYRNRPLWFGFLIKSATLLVAAFLMTMIAHLADKYFTMHLNPVESFHYFLDEKFGVKTILKSTLYWLILFLITQLFLEISNKYAPGVFRAVLAGKYIKPKTERRIIMFMDLKDSTPIAEKLGHEQYFLFIRDFIYQLSIAIIEHRGIIYQYVGDEVVASWEASEKNAKRSIQAIIAARKNIQKANDSFRVSFNVVPEFRVGIHAGDVTIGEIGVIKRDLAMSGDIMNTTARIRTACTELNQKFVVSGDFLNFTSLESWQAESLGLVELKGKASSLDLFALKI